MTQGNSWSDYWGPLDNFVVAQVQNIGPGQIIHLGDSQVARLWWNSSNGTNMYGYGHTSINARIVNAGYGGATLEDVLARWPAVLDQLIASGCKPRGVAIALGSNNLLCPGSSNDAFGDDCLALLNLHVSRGITPCWLSVIPPELTGMVAQANVDEFNRLNALSFGNVLNAGLLAVNINSGPDGNFVFYDPNTQCGYPGSTVDGIHLNASNRVTLYNQFEYALQRINQAQGL